MSLARGRAVSAVVAVAAGFVTGWLAARAGGSLGRAPAALAVMAAGLGTCGLCIGAMLGFLNDKAGTVVGLVVALAAYYAGLLAASPFYSFVGDALVTIVSAVPACVAAAAGFVIGGQLPRARQR